LEIALTQLPEAVDQDEEEAKPKVTARKKASKKSSILTQH
jgi:hypothetical protein